MPLKDSHNSVRRDQNGHEHHWMDAVRVYKPVRLKKLPKQKASLPGQLSLFDPPPKKKR